MIGLARSFLPWIAFPMILDNFHASKSAAALVCTAIALAANFNDLSKGFVIPWASLCFFAGLALGYWLSPEAEVLHYSSALFALLLFVICVLSIAGRKPLTIQYARQDTPEEFWNTRAFFEINRHLTMTLSAMFACIALFSVGAVMLSAFEPLFRIGSYTVILISALLCARYPAYYLARLE